MYRFVTIATLVAGLALSGCMAGAGSSGEADAADDSFLGAGGKTDTGGVEEGSPEAIAVLSLVNEASLATLDDPASTGAVGLDTRAAHNIVAYRLGDDGVEGTDDDEAFDDLAELDAIPYVGPRAFGKLLEYALEHDYGTPSDTGGIIEGTPEAAAVLDLANRASLETLDDPSSEGGVGLDVRAAEGIVAYRAGDDGTEGTDDDETFDTLAELDAISYVGARAFGKLLDYALDHGYGESALPVESCTGDFTSAEVQQAYRDGVWLDFHLHRYTRDCDVTAGTKTCTEWSEIELPAAEDAYGGHTDDRFTATIEPSDASLRVEVTGSSSTTYKATGELAQNDDGTTDLSLTFTYRGFTEVCDDYSWGAGWGSGGCLRSHYDYWNDTWMTLTGAVSESCLVLSDEVVRSDEVDFGEGNISYTETVDMAVSDG